MTVVERLKHTCLRLKFIIILRELCHLDNGVIGEDVWHFDSHDVPDSIGDVAGFLERVGRGPQLDDVEKFSSVGG